MVNINTEGYWDNKHNKNRDSHIADVRDHFEAIKKFIPENSKVLEIGAGLGDLCYLVYHNISKNLYAADISSVSLDIIKKKIPNIQTIKMPFEPTEINEKEFDVIIISHTLEHIENPKSYMDKWAKSLKKDGTIIVAVPLNDTLYSEHLRIYTVDNFEEFIKSLGYKYSILTRKRPKGEEAIGILSNKVNTKIRVDIPKGITANKKYLPNTIYIEVTNHCNSNCPMCPRKTMKRPLGFMPWWLFEEIVEKLVPIEGKGLEIFLHYMGEPLMDLTLPEKIKHLKNKLPNSNVGISTNGELLDQRTAKELVEAGLDYMTISVDAATQKTYTKLRGFKLEELKYKVDRLLNAKKGSNLKIVIQFIKSKLNEDEVPAFEEYWKNKDVTKVVKPMHSFLNAANSYLTKQKSETQLLPCMQPFMYMIIYWNGDLGLCCWDADRYVKELGNIRDGSIEKLFNSKKYKEIRKKMLKGEMNDFFPCKDCLQIFGYDMNLGIYNKRLRIKR